MISGLLAAPGIAFGKALVIKKERPVVDHNPIAASALPQQVDLFFKARHHSLQQLSALQQKTQATLGAETAAIFEAHSLLVEDKVLEQKIIDYIHQYKVTAATAIQTIFEQQATELDQLTDTYLQARAADLRDIALRLLKNAQGVPIVDLTVLSHPVILVTDDLTPSETAQLDTNYVLGFITDLGSQTSHTAIMARSLELPAIVGTNIITQQVVTGDTLILDAINNAIYINPDAVTTEQLRTLHHTHQQQKAALAELKNLPAVTLDGHTVEVCANIGHLRDLQGVHQYGAEGIGLYRTEFLFMERDALPSEEEQFQAYKSVAEQMGHHAVVIRTVDIGGDKALPFIQLPLESNPFLGCRGIRLCFQYPHILECQLRAILRASAFGKIRILFPMIIAVEEVRSLKTILNQIKQALTTEGHLFDASIEIGVMIETPAAALLVPHLAQEVDFFSIGTNDLIQYTLAVDRGNELIATLYNPLSPAVFCLIKQVIEAAHQAGKWVGMCGELAGDERATCLLLGLGLDEFSMSASAIPGIKKIIRSSHFKQTQLLAQQALAQPTAQDIIQLVTRCALVENALSGCASPLSAATP